MGEELNASMVNRQTAYLARDFARFYDWGYEGVEDDLQFYVNAARKYGEPVLELACGTGRVTIPLAREGFTVTGLDISAEMLKIAREKVGREAPEIQERVKLLQGDMSDFQLDTPAHLVLIPQSSFFHLHTRKQQENCLACAHAALAPNGALIVDLSPARMMANQAVGVTVVVEERPLAPGGAMVRELNRKLAIDQQSQCVTVEHTYMEEQPDGSEKRFVFLGDYTWVTGGQMRKMLRAAGFGRIEVLGGYDRQPFTDSSDRMIFVASK